VPKVRLDKLIVDQGLAATITKAQALIIAGCVDAKGSRPLKPGTLVDPSEQVTIRNPMPYVSRGGLKLESAMVKFRLPCANKVCLDIGASTGGFTDYLLQHGAKKVYAVDVGRGLLDYGLSRDPRVVNLEGMNFRYFTRQNLKDGIEFVTIDVSFISLDKILPKASEILEKNGDIIAMVKPQFELSPKDLRKGVVKDENLRLAAIGKIKELSAGLGLKVLAGADSAVKGPSGNIEHFLWMRKTNAD